MTEALKFPIEPKDSDGDGPGFTTESVGIVVVENGYVLNVFGDADFTEVCEDKDDLIDRLKNLL
jgi:hypothetical protein